MIIGGRVREIDCAYSGWRVAGGGWRVAIEYDGWQVHRDRGHSDDDRDKMVLLELVGWIAIPVTAAWTASLLVERVREAIALQVVGPRAANP
jgi:hypothetical protein